MELNRIDVEIASAIVMLDGVAVAGRANRSRMEEAERCLDRARKMLQEVKERGQSQSDAADAV